jgi:hypothetical protein
VSQFQGLGDTVYREMGLAKQKIKRDWSQRDRSPWPRRATLPQNWIEVGLGGRLGLFLLVTCWGPGSQHPVGCLHRCPPALLP